MKKLGLFLLFPSFYVYTFFFLFVIIVMITATPNNVTIIPRIVMVVVFFKVSGTSTSWIFSNTDPFLHFL